MKTYRICVAGGRCGARMMVSGLHLQGLLRTAGYDREVTLQSHRDHHANLILEFLPAFTEVEVGCSVINTKPLLGDLNQLQVIDKVLKQV